MLADVEIQIVAYNSWPLIETCLASVDRHAPRPGIKLTVKVLDNASSDDTADKVASCFPHVRLVRSDKNTLYGPASNALVAESDAEFVLLLNPDTELLDDVISPLVESLCKNAEADVALPAVIDTAGNTQPVVQRFPTLRYELAKLLQGTKASRAMRKVWDTSSTIEQIERPKVPSGQPFSADFVWSTCIMMRRKMAARLGPFSPEFPMYDTDLDLSRRMAEEGVRAIYLPHVRVRHVGGASSSRSAKVSMMRTARTKYYRRFHGPFSAAAFTTASMAIPALKRARRRAQRLIGNSGTAS